MPTQDLTTREEVEALMQPDGPAALIDFWAPWCGPCRSMAPEFEAAAEALSDRPVAFYKINTEAHPDLSAAFSVRSLPTIIAVRNGEIQDVVIGLKNRATLQSMAERLAKKSEKKSFLQRIFG